MPKIFIITAKQFLRDLHKILPREIHLNVDIDGIIRNNKIERTDIVLTIGNYPDEKETEFTVDRKSKIGKLVEKLFREILKTSISELNIEE